MVVGVEHAVEPADAGVEQLLAKVGRGVDQHGGRALGARPLDQQRAAPPPILRIGRIARAPMIADARHAARRAAAENGELQRHAALSGAFRAERGTFLNSRKKFSVVSARHLALAHAAQGGKPRRGMHDEGGLVGLAAQRLRRKIRRIGLDQQPVRRHRQRDVAQRLGVLEGDDAGEGDVAAERKPACAQARLRR